VDRRDLTCASNVLDIDHVEHGWPLSNVILGVSVENQAYADERLPLLTKLKGRHVETTMASYEPALGPIVFGADLPDWVIFGGESGAGARPCHLEWAESVKVECAKAGKAFFMKQTGKLAYQNGEKLVGLRRKGEYERVPPSLQVRQVP